MENKDFYTHEEMLDRYVGKEGTVNRQIYHDDLYNELIGKKFREYRKNRKLSISDIAKKTGVSTSVISRLEKDTSSISLYTINRIFRPLGLKCTFDFEF